MGSLRRQLAALSSGGPAAAAGTGAPRGRRSPLPPLLLGAAALFAAGCQPGPLPLLDAGAAADLPAPPDQAPLEPPADLRAPPPLLPEVTVPGGSYLMGTPAGAGGDDDERPAHPVTVGPLSLGRTEVTVAQYRLCVEAGACAAPAPQTDAIDSCNWRKEARDDYPMNCLSQGEAAAFCAWHGRRLPTEEEWEYAARGARGATYPWGEEAPAAQLCWEGLMVRVRTCPVAAYPATLLGRVDPQGVYDLAGNVWEWTSQRHCPYTETGRKDCDEPTYVVRGGSAFSELPKNGRGADRFAVAPDEFYGYVGLRCFGP